MQNYSKENQNINTDMIIEVDAGMSQMNLNNKRIKKIKIGRLMN